MGHTQLQFVPQIGQDSLNGTVYHKVLVDTKTLKQQILAQI
jgi:hypothetical protein